MDTEPEHVPLEDQEQSEQATGYTTYASAAPEPPPTLEYHPEYEVHTDPQPPVESTPAPFDTFWTPPPKENETERPSSRAGRRFLAWLLAVALGASGGAGGAWYVLRHTGSGTGTSVNVVAPPVSNISSAPQNPVASVAAAVLPSIVKINVSSLRGDGLGSGVIYSADGYILTNNHVIEGADSITVNLATGEKVPAQLIGTAIGIGVDIAVIKISKTALPAATFGSLKSLHVGDLAVAVGSPFGLQATVTAGVISALHRGPQDVGGSSVTDAIQTDAPINPGNSGGALADGQGAVIGINTAIIGSSGNVGVGFAIPIDIARKVADQMISGKRAQLAYLGVVGENVPNNGGAHIGDIVSSGPAAQAGIKIDDIIVKLDGTPIVSMDDLIEKLIEKNAGDVVTMELKRSGKAVTVTATLAARPEG